MKIKDIYFNYNIPPNLQEHMFRVYGVTQFIHRHWQGSDPVDWNLVSQIALVHDLANVIKFDFGRHPEFLGREAKNIDHWRQVQSEMIAKYGTNEHQATIKILKEIPVSQKAIRFVTDKRFTNSLAVAESKFLELKILYYGDLRVLPDRVGSLAERLTDIKTRYREMPDLENLINAAYQIENQIQSRLDISVTEINDRTALVSKKSIVDLEI